MAWNGSGNNKASDKAKKKRPAGASGFGHGLFAGLIVVAIGAAALYVLMGGRGEKAVPKAEKKPVKIAEAEPVKVGRKAAEKVEEKETPYWERPTTNGLNEAQIRKWKFMHQKPPSYTNMVATLGPKPKFAIFPTFAENRVAMLMTIEPGTTLVGSPEYDERFREEFMKSCETPIIAEPDDDDYRRELKEAMKRMKIELLDRVRNGEDLCRIMTDAHNEAMRLGTIRQEIEQSMREMIKDSAESEADIDDAVAAANKLLESKGINPIRMNPVLKQGFLHSLGVKQ